MRDRPQIEARFYETYYFASVIRNVLNNQFTYLRNLDEFYGDLRSYEFSEPFPKYSAFHSFIEFVVEDLMFDELLKVNSQRLKASAKKSTGIPIDSPLGVGSSGLPINRALDHHEIRHQSFAVWLEEHERNSDEPTEDDALDYFNDLRLEGPVETLLERMVDEVFLVMFANRGIMKIFNDMMAEVISGIHLEELTEDKLERFSGDGRLKRVHIPKWVQRAVFYRDRGRCVLCSKDVSGQVSIGSAENYDHIVPLSKGGLNDVTNFQLLCESCNSIKSDKNSDTSHVYESWY